MTTERRWAVHWRGWLTSFLVAALLGVCLGTAYVAATDRVAAPTTSPAALPAPGEQIPSSSASERATRSAPVSGLSPAAQRAPAGKAAAGTAKDPKPLKAKPSKEKAKPSKAEPEPAGKPAGKAKKGK